MLTWIQLKRGSRLALAVVEMPVVGGDDLAGRGEVCVHEDVEVPRTFVDLAGRLDD